MITVRLAVEAVGAVPVEAATVRGEAAASVEAVSEEAPSVAEVLRRDGKLKIEN
jgi:hypothetical protein